MLDQIRKGAKFADLAKKHSDGPSAKEGGDLSYFKRGTLSKELEDKVFALKAGEVTDVIRTKQGYVILKVDRTSDGGHSHAEGSRAAHPGCAVHAEAAARAARLSDHVA